jgi:hypothetical protein
MEVVSLSVQIIESNKSLPFIFGRLFLDDEYMVDVWEENDVSLSTGDVGVTFDCAFPSASLRGETAGVPLETDAVLEFVVGRLND